MCLIYNSIYHYGEILYEYGGLFLDVLYLVWIIVLIVTIEIYQSMGDFLYQGYEVVIGIINTTKEVIYEIWQFISNRLGTKK